MLDGTQLQGGRGAIIQHRAKQELRGWLYATVIRYSLCEARRHPASAAMPRDCNPCWVNAEFTGMLEKPLLGLEAILKFLGEGVLRCTMIGRRRRFTYSLII